jgi:hypothetical protein
VVNKPRNSASFGRSAGGRAVTRSKRPPSRQKSAPFRFHLQHQPPELRQTRSPTSSLRPPAPRTSHLAMARTKKPSADDAGELMVSVESYTRTRDSVSCLPPSPLPFHSARMLHSLCRSSPAAPAPVATTVSLRRAAPSHPRPAHAPDAHQSGRLSPATRAPCLRRASCHRCSPEGAARTK